MSNNSSITRIHTAPSTPGEQDVFLVTSWRGKPATQSGDTTIFNKILPGDWGYKGFTLDASPKEAQYILAPHSVRRMDEKGTKYVADMHAYAAQYGKPLIIFTGGDLQHDVFIDDAIVLKGSQYRPLLRQNEILMPGFTEDLIDTWPVTIRNKSERPVVGFCGYADINTALGWAKLYLRNAQLDAQALVTGNRSVRAHKRGIYFRRKAMWLLESDPRIDTRFIVRKTFSGNKKLISVDPARARQEYLENMRDCDLALTPKGDGNFSTRFLKALAFGRIPILVDTDMVLPLEDVIDYSTCVLRVPYTELARLPDIVADFYASLSNEQFIEMQHQARRVFAQYLRSDSFFNYLFGVALARA